MRFTKTKRKFGGKTFSIVLSVHTKADALHHAKEFRKDGYARVTKKTWSRDSTASDAEKWNMYFVWFRRK